MRGEHVSNVFAALQSPGSSPHARGALRLSGGDGVPDGIIPACAGSTADVPVSVNNRSGSSPHARGALSLHDRYCVDAGIIPACAGSTVFGGLLMWLTSGSSPHARGAQRLSRRPDRHDRDHPRMRGEHFTSFRLAARSLGIIPACAGSTLANAVRLSTKLGSSPHARGAPCVQRDQDQNEGDHPRMRGEH